MAKNTENNNVETVETVDNNKVKMSDIIVEQEDSMPKKIIKWVLGGLACVATGVAGFFIGRASKGDDDNDSDNSVENDNSEE